MRLPFNDKKFVFLVVGVVIVLALEVLSLVGVEIPNPYAPLLFALFIALYGNRVVRNGFKALIHLRFSSINLLMLIAVAGAYYLGEYPEAAVVIVLYVLGERMEDIGIENSKAALDELVRNSPKTAFVKGVSEPVQIASVEVGSVVLVKPGEVFPLDGIIVQGETIVDEAPITGEPIPKDKHVGDEVFAGTINKNSFVEIKTTRSSTDTTFSKIVKLTFEAQANKSETQKFIQKFSRFYTPSIIAIAVAMFVVGVFVFDQLPNQSLKQAITLLVIACPCALVISTPVAIYAAIGNASSRGIMVKGGKFIEAMAGIKAIALDKTRTITYGRPIVSDVIPLNVASEEELLACASGAEVFSEHPLAEAIVAASTTAGFEPHKVEQFKSVPGKGATAKCLVCEDEHIYIGKLSFIQEHQPVDQDAERIVERLTSEGKTSVVISFGKGVAGIIGLIDEIKPDSAEAVAAIKKLNIEPVILSGDSNNAVRFVAAELDIQRAYGNLLPDEKARMTRDLMIQHNSIAMVGDGINDAPALAQSTVGIAMGAAGSGAAIETANIALMNDKLSLIPFLVRLSRATVSRIRVNTVSAILVKVLFVSLAFFGLGNLVFAIAADVGVTIVVIALSLRLVDFE